MFYLLIILKVQNIFMILKSLKIYFFQKMNAVFNLQYSIKLSNNKEEKKLNSKINIRNLNLE